MGKLKRNALLLAGLGALASWGKLAHGQITPPTLDRTNYAQTTFNGGVNFSVKFFDYNQGTGNTGLTNLNTRAGSFTTSLYEVDLNKNDAAGPLIDTYKTYCVDLFEVIGSIQEVNVSQQNGVVQSAIAGDPGLYPSGGRPQNPVNIDRNIGAAAYIYYAAELGQVAGIANLISSYVAVASSSITRQNQIEAAIQLAIWEVTFDGINDDNQIADASTSIRDINSGSGVDNRVISDGFKSGAFQLQLNSNANYGLDAVKWGVVQLSSQILALANDSSDGLGAYKKMNGTYFNFASPDIRPPANGAFRQDQIFAAVPEPATYLSALPLLAGGIFWARRRRKV